MTSTTARGYGSDHQRERARWETKLLTEGPIPCARGCGQVIQAGDTWDLGHTDDRKAWTGPECVPCNRGAGGRNGRRAQLARSNATIRDW